MTDTRRYAVWPEPRSRSLKGSRPSVPHGTNFSFWTPHFGWTPRLK